MLTDAEVMAFAATSDLERATRFYRDTLGLTHVETTPYAAVFRGGGTMVRVTLAEEVRPAPYTVLGWIVGDIATAMAGLDVEFTRYDGMGQDAAGVWTTPNGDRIAWFTDPDGNVLSLTQFV
jgi:catechol 2,3-dioxygenase-like lactoylglutathione lyase family enzyme